MRTLCIKYEEFQSAARDLRYIGYIDGSIDRNLLSRYMGAIGMCEAANSNIPAEVLR